MPDTRSPLFILILLTYLLAGGLYASLTPAWQAPDEPAHYNYIRYVSTQGSLPELVSGCYDQAYLSELTTRRFPPELAIDTICYEFHQPPLYYLLQTPLFLISRGSLLALRLFSVLLGAGVVGLAFLIGRTTFPNRPTIAYGTMAFVAFVPMHVAILASANNDALAELIFAAILLLLVRRLRPPPHRLKQSVSPLWPVFDRAKAGAVEDRPEPRQRHNPQSPISNLSLSLLLGLGLITKMTVYIAVPLIAVALWLAVRPDQQGRANWLQLGQQAVVIYGLAFLIALPWYGRNALLYGNLDIFGRIRHDEIVAGQLRTTDFIGKEGWLTYLSNFVTTTFHSFWGQFGWMAVPMDSRTYQLLTILTLIALAGLIGFWILDFGFWIDPPLTPNLQSPTPNPELLTPNLQSPNLPISPLPRQALLLMTLTVALMFLGYLSYNLTFLQLQGRYLFPALIPLGVLFAVGLGQAFLFRWQWVLVAGLGLGLLWIVVASVREGGLDKWGVLIMGLAVGIAAGRIFLARYRPIPSTWLLVLCYGGLALLTLLSPFWFVIPFLSR